MRRRMEEKAVGKERSHRAPRRNHESNYKIERIYERKTNISGEFRGERREKEAMEGRGKGGIAEPPSLAQAGI